LACGAQGSTGAGRLAQEADTNAAVRFLMALYQYTRPHTMLGTFVSVISVSLLALQGEPVTALALKGMATALVPALLMNICIVGMNQLYDVEIDKVNKPYLPLASGEFSMTTGISIVALTGFVSVVLGVLSGSMALLCTLLSSLALGVVYSVELPMLRWKQNPLLAAVCVLSVRAVVVQLGFYLHMLGYTASAATALQPGLATVPALISGPLAFTIGFMLLFSIVIALFKDIPDTNGDMQANVRTLTVRWGVEKVFWICVALLELGYTGAIAYGATRQILWSKVLVMLGHAVLGGLLWRRAQEVNLSDHRSITECYMFVWKLFYLEYLFIPLFR